MEEEFHKGIWTLDEERLLKENYQSKSLAELKGIIRRKEGSIAARVYFLASSDSEEWNFERAKELMRDHIRKERGIKPENYQLNQFWTSDDNNLLRENYMSKSSEELGVLLRRSEGAVVNRLYLEATFYHKEEWNIERVRELQKQYRKKKNEKCPKSHKSSYFWTDEEIGLLLDNYDTNSLDYLSQIIGRSEEKIVSKLYDLARKNLNGFDAKRAKDIANQYHREMRRQYRNELRNADLEKRIVPIKKPKNEVYKRMLVKERKWSERDVTILANTYFSHSWIELIKIFRLKSKEVCIKLKELYNQEPDAWDIGRIVELENDSKKYTLEEVRSIVGYCRPMIVQRRPEIDRLIKQGLSLRNIAEKLGVTYQAISQYKVSRDI